MCRLNRIWSLDMEAGEEERRASAESRWVEAAAMRKTRWDGQVGRKTLVCIWTG